jgi:hypothetical protein
MKRVTLAVSVALLLSACSGQMQGVVRGTGQPAVFNYEQGMDSDSYTAVLDGEAFKGRAVMDGAGTTMGTGFGSAGGSFFTT